MTTANEIAEQSKVLHENGTEPLHTADEHRHVYITGPRYGRTGALPAEALTAYENIAMRELKKGGSHVTVAPTFWRQFQRSGPGREPTGDLHRPDIHPGLATADEMIVLHLPGWQDCEILKAEIERAGDDGIEVREVSLGQTDLGRDANTNLMKRIPEGERVQNRGPGMQCRVTTEYRAVIETEQGEMVFALDPTNAPATCGNFMHLCDGGYYDDAKIHMIVRDHTLHGGCTQGDGTTDAGYVITPENGKTAMEKGDLAMTGTTGGNSARWFIVTADKMETPEPFTVFGKLIDGGETLARLNETEVNDWDASQPMAPKAEIKISKARVKREIHERLEPYVKPAPPTSEGAKGGKKK